VECLEAKFAKVSLQDITNVPLPGLTLRLSRDGASKVYFGGLEGEQMAFLELRNGRD